MYGSVERRESRAIVRRIDGSVIEVLKSEIDAVGAEACIGLGVALSKAAGAKAGDCGTRGSSSGWRTSAGGVSADCEVEFCSVCTSGGARIEIKGVGLVCVVVIEGVLEMRILGVQRIAW